MSAAIEVEGLCKTFRVPGKSDGMIGTLRQLLRPTSHEVDAVADISFRIEPGERVAFVGQNGAGKSTTLKMLCGILHPSRGHARVCGYVPWQARMQLAHRVGVVFGQRSQLHYHLTPSDTFRLLERVYDRQPADHEKRRASLVDAFGIGEVLHKQVSKLSLGQRMRCEIVASLLHAPSVVFLDEPTIGLDVSIKAAIRDLLREQSSREGRTILLTSHDTGDMERVCERVIVINRGRLLLDQPVHELRRTYVRKKRVVVQSAEREFTLELAGVRVLSRAPHRTELEVDAARIGIEAVLAELTRAVRVLDITIEDPPMEEVVSAIYRGADAVPCGAQAPGAAVS